MSSRTANGVLALSGYALRISVERGHLLVEDGIADNRRTARFSRVERSLKRLVVHGHSGTISLEALRWMRDTGTAFIQIDHDGEVVSTSTPSAVRDPRLLRAQVLGRDNGVGLEITRELIRQKIEGQQQVLERLGAADHPEMAAALEDLERARTYEEIRLAEARAALTYWALYAAVPVQFARRDWERIPEHWMVCGSRRSPVSMASRNAATPANALLNYLYAIVEAETRLATLTVGLDPALGFLHADLRSRDSFVYDLLEPIRPAADACVLDLIERQTFRKGDFFENAQGICRLMPHMAERLIETAPQWAKLIAPVVERVAAELVALECGGALPTPLTQANRSAGRAKQRRKLKVKLQTIALDADRSCGRCGVQVDGKRRFCEECLPERETEKIGSAHEALAQRRAAGDSPGHGGEATKRRAARIAEEMRLNQEWEAANPEGRDPEVFEREILPLLKEVPVRKIAAVLGLSEPYCSGIRSGKRAPHPRHWEVLRTTVLTPE